MAGEMRRIEFVATTLDVDHWHPGWRAAAAESRTDDYHDWVFRQLRQTMYEAGQAFIEMHPDLFACGLT